MAAARPHALRSSVRTVLILILACRVCPAQGPETRGSSVALAASLDGCLTCEVKAAPGTRVAVAASARLSPDGTRLGDDGDAVIVTLSEPLLRGTTNQDGVFRTRIPVDPRLRGRLPADPPRPGCAHPPRWKLDRLVERGLVEGRARIAFHSRSLGGGPARGAPDAGVPAGSRPHAAARVIAAVTLVAAPLLLARTFAADCCPRPPRRTADLIRQPSVRSPCWRSPCGRCPRDRPAGCLRSRSAP